MQHKTYTLELSGAYLYLPMGKCICVYDSVKCEVHVALGHL